MRILDKYILKEFVGPFLFGICAFTSVFVGTGTLYRIANLINEYGASLWAVTRVFALALPSIIILTFPMSTLLGSLLAFGRLSSSSEIIVMRAGGQNFTRLAMPVYILAFIISIVTIGFNEYVVPRSNHAYETIIREEIKHNAVPPTQEHIVIKNTSGENIERLMYARQFDSRTKELRTITLQEFQDNVLVRMEKAERAIWQNGKWEMQNGIIYDLSSTGDVERNLRFTKQTLPITQGPKDIKENKKDPEEMTIHELKDQIKALEANHVNTNKLKIEMYNRFALPMASLVCALVGAPLGLQKQRGSSSIGFGISVIVIFVYYSVMTLATAMGKAGNIPPLLAVWMPNILCGIAGIYLNWRASK